MKSLSKIMSKFYKTKTELEEYTKEQEALADQLDSEINELAARRDTADEQASKAERIKAKIEDFFELNEDL